MKFIILENGNIRNLKRLIEMTIRWIELIEYTNDIQEDMGV
ncbi:hypothetical protein [Peptacetobacter sp.]|nr:hypothetical protein [Peptacetobacter sp.]